MSASSSRSKAQPAVSKKPAGPSIRSIEHERMQELQNLGVGPDSLEDYGHKILSFKANVNAPEPTRQYQTAKLSRLKTDFRMKTLGGPTLPRLGKHCFEVWTRKLRNATCVKKTEERESWILTIKTTGGAAKSSSPVKIAFKSEDVPAQHRQDLESSVLEIWERLPVDPSSNDARYKSRAADWQRLIRTCALLNVGVRVPVDDGLFRLNKRPDRDGLVWRVDVFIVQNDLLSPVSVWVNPVDMDLSNKAPSIPDNIDFGNLSTTVTGNTKDEREKSVLAREVAKYIQVLGTGRVTTLNEFRAYKDGVIKSFWNPLEGGLSQSGVYNGKPAWVVSHEYDVFATRITIGSAAMGEMDILNPPSSETHGEEGGVQLRSLLGHPVRLATINNRQIAQVIDRGLQGWIKHGDFLMGHVELARGIDVINSQIGIARLGNSSCDCVTADTKNQTYHSCAKCDMPVPCRDLLYDCSQLHRVCARCYDLEPRQAYHSIRNNLRMLIRREALCQNKPYVGDPHLLDEILEDVETSAGEQWRDWTEIQDVWSANRYRFNNALPDPNDPSKLIGFKKTFTAPFKIRRNPFAPSIEALMPAYPRNGKGGRHVPGNVRFTALAFNLARGLFPPAILHEISRSLRSDPSESEKRLLDINSRCIRYVKELPHYLTNCMGGEMTSAQLEEAREIWRCVASAGIVNDESCYTVVPNVLKFEKKSWADWKPREHSRVMFVIEEMERDSKTKMARGEDGCPYPFHTWRMSRWTWAICYTYFTWRVEVMYAGCNRLHEQVDVPETLFLTVARQYCYPSNLRILSHLPVLPHLSGPLTLSIGHLHHGLQLRSGWNQIRPTSASQWDDQLANISIETAFENFLKNDFDEEYYPILVAELKNLTVPSEYYDSSHGEVEEDLEGTGEADGREISSQLSKLDTLALY